MNGAQATTAPAEGTLRLLDKLTGIVRLEIPPEITAAMRHQHREHVAHKWERRRYWRKARTAARTACASPALLKDLRENDRLDELAGWLMIFGDTDGLRLFRETLLASGTFDGIPAERADKIMGDVWNDHHESPGDWRDLIRHVRELEQGTEPPPGASVSPSSLLTGAVNLILGSSIEPKPYDWLWPGMLVRGKLHLIAGGPGCGKTTIALSFAATVTTGGRWPDGTKAPASDVLIWSAEDDAADTLVPRLRSAGADMDRIHFVQGEDRRPFDPATDMLGLRAAAERLGNVGLMIVDPIVSAVAGDSHKNAETRRGLQPLVDLAQSLNAALLGITHYTKGTAGRDPLERVTGSLAFGAVARIVFAAAKVKDEASGNVERIFVRMKSNIGPDGGGFKFALEEDAPVPNYPGLTASTVRWGGPLEGAAQDLLKEAEGAERSSKTEDAAELIQGTIRTKGGAASATDLHTALKAAGIGRDTRYRAIDGLLTQHRIARVKHSENGPWTYIFPRRGGVGDVSAFDPPVNSDLVAGAA